MRSELYIRFYLVAGEAEPMGVYFSSASFFSRGAGAKYLPSSYREVNAHIKIQPDFFTSPAESEKYFYTRKIRLIDVFTVGNRVGRCSFHVGLQLDHLNGRRRRFVALVSVF